MAELERRARVKPIDRRQLLLRPVDVEGLVAAEHPVRAIWELVGQLDLSGFYEAIEAVEGEAGRPAIDPRLLISLWIYAYSRGVNSAREVARLCGHDPAFQWLTGMEEINYHTLSDFRVKRKQELDELFARLLGVLSAEGLVTLERVMHDGTKVRASAGADTFRREERIRAHLELARKHVEEMGDPRSEEMSNRVAAARRRAARERQQRLEKALEELKQIRATKSDEESKQQTRASMTDPQARIMKQPDGGHAPSYNVQISTDAAAGVIVAVGVTQSGSDYRELVPGIERIEANLERLPEQMVADGGFTSRENILSLNEKSIDFVGAMGEREAQSIGQMQRRGISADFYPAEFAYDAATDTYTCPAAKSLRHDRKETRIGQIVHQYRAHAADCQACCFKDRCCPTAPSKGRAISRRVEDPVVAAFLAKMQTDQAKEIYRRRGAVAEFSNLWIKAKLGLRQFRLRGLLKTGIEAVWASLTYNFQIWIRLRWRTQWAT
jgi:transposase